MKHADQSTQPASATGLFRSWRYLFCLIVLLVAIAGFYVEENWRGQRALKMYQREIEDRGQTLDRSTFVPQPVADSQNFANTPLLAGLFDFYPGTQKFASTNALARTQAIAPLFDSAKRTIKENNKEPRSNSWVTAHLDLDAWHEAFLASKEANNLHENKASLPGQSIIPNAHGDISTNPLNANPSQKEAATVILASLSECEPVLKQIRDDSQRPFSRFNIRYHEKNPAGILLPHLAVLKHLTEILQLRLSAELALGRTEDAFNDLRLMLYLTNAMRDEPIMISHLVRIAQMRLVLAAIASGMREWSGPELEELQRLLREFNFCADLKRAMQAERTFFGGGVIDFIRDSPKELNSVLSSTSSNEQFPDFLLADMPSGWFDLEKLNYYKLFDKYLAPEVLEVHRVSPARLDQAQKQIELALRHSSSALFLRHRFLARILIPNLEGAIRKAAFAQQGVEAAILACALERYRRSHQHYPDRLDWLVSECVPNLSTDIISGQPLHYKSSGDAHYLLYSVGWNEIDDGGKVFSGKVDAGAGRLDRESSAPSLEADWVWTE
jgi:hypothetical protein